MRKDGICRHCGTAFVYEQARKPSYYCSKTCREAAFRDSRRAPKLEALKARTCLDCGCGIGSLHFRAVRCNECRRKRRNQYVAERLRRRRPPYKYRPVVRCRGPFCCQHCGNEYMAGPKKDQGEKYCSSACALMGRKAVAAKKRPVRMALRGLASCLKRLEGFFRKVIRPANTAKPVVTVCCLVCQTAFTPRGKAKACSKACSKKLSRRLRRRSPSGRAAKAKAKAFRRSRELAEVHSFDPIRILERDGWCCRLCGVPTPRELRGSYEPNAPELDHVIPLSKGGRHHPDNVQCACRACNSSKSDKLAA